MLKTKNQIRKTRTIVSNSNSRMWGRNHIRGPRLQLAFIVFAAIVAVFAVGIASTDSTPVSSVEAQTADIQISNLSIPMYQIDDFAAGIRVYVDRSTTLQSIPASLDGNIKYISTANDDKFGTANPFLSFNVDRDATIAVAYDDRLPLPGWLQSYTPMGEALTIGGNPHSLYMADFPQGTISLGGNEGVQSSSMYVVLATVQGTLTDPPPVDPPPPAPGQIDWLRVEGNKIVNESGGIVVLRGVNIENREWSWAFTKSIDFERRAIPKATKSPADNDGWGSNVILIAIASGPVNRGEQDYLAALDEIVSIAKAEGAYTLMVYRYGEPNSQQANFPDQAAEDAMAALAARYANEPAVLYGLQVEPAKLGSIYQDLTQQEFWDQVLKPRFDTMVAAIHSNNPNALIAVPGTQWGRKIHWALDNPVVGNNLVYKTHPYDSWNSIQSSYRLDEVAAIYPVVLGEFGTSGFMSQSDVDSLIDFAEQQGMSWIAWLFHDVGCPCLLSDAGTFAPSAYGQEIKTRLQAAATNEPPPPPPPPVTDPKILVFHKTGKFVHSSTDDGVAAVHQLGVDNGFQVDDTIDPSVFTDANLAQYDAVVFLNTHQEVMDDSQQAAFERYIQAGGGYAGIHIASGTEYDWGWYGGLVGARFNFHPDIQQAAVIIEDSNHPSTASLPAVWLRSDEWYNFFNGPDRSKLHILARLDESTYSGGIHGDDHPIAWCQEYDGGRSWYTAMGHNDEHYYDPLFLSHILGGIQYAAGIVSADCSPTPEPPPPPPPPVPGIVSNINLAGYSAFESAFNNGVKVYNDRTFVFENVPGSLIGSTYIMTANNDKQETANPFLSFDVDRNVTVSVAYDDRLSPPTWLSDFTDTGLDLQINGNNHSLFSKNFLQGTVQLGANEGIAESSMYSVIITESAADGPALSISLPVEAETIYEANLPVFYSLSGDTADVDRVSLSLNGGSEVSDFDLDGKYIFANMQSGSYSLTAYLARADGSQIAGTEVTVSFEYADETFPGNPPITPRWAFEPWVWEDNTNTQASTQSIVEGYRSRNIPVGAVIVDSPWESRYNTMTFNSNNYPDPQAMIDDFHSKGVKVIMWITGFQNTDSPLYDTMRSSGYAVNNGDNFSWWKGTGAHLDFTNPDARAWWHGLMDNVLDMGIDGWKADQGADMLRTAPAVETYLGPMSKDEFKKYYYADFFDYTLQKNPQGIVLARPYSWQGGLGAPVSKLSIGWVGDNNGNWEGLRLQIRDNYTSAQAGYGAFGAEIGGYNCCETPDKNLLLRWTQFGSMVPLMENGGVNGGEAEHLPWSHDGGTDGETVEIYRYFATLHSELVPYIFSYGVESNLNGGSIMRNPDEPNWQHQLGEQILVSALTDDVFQKTVSFPAGSDWVDYWNTDMVYTGGTTINYDVPLDRYPIFIKSGSIIPMRVGNSITGHGDATSAGKETLLVFPDGDTSFLYHKPLGDGVEYSDVMISMSEFDGLISVDGGEIDDYRFRVKWPLMPLDVEGADAWSYDSASKTLVIDKTGQDFQLQIVRAFPTLPGQASPVQDNDGDGLAEDMNANNRFDFADLVVFFKNLDSPAVQLNPSLFDFNRNRMVDMGDVISLFQMIIPK